MLKIILEKWNLKKKKSIKKKRNYAKILKAMNKKLIILLVVLFNLQLIQLLHHYQ